MPVHMSPGANSKKESSQGSSISSPLLNGSRIINLENLQEHVQTIVNLAHPPAEIQLMTSLLQQ